MSFVFIKTLLTNRLQRLSWGHLDTVAKNRWSTFFLIIKTQAKIYTGRKNKNFVCKHERGLQ